LSLTHPSQDGIPPERWYCRIKEEVCRAGNGAQREASLSAHEHEASDDSLIARLKRRDEKALDELLRKHGPWVFSRLERGLRGSVCAADVDAIVFDGLLRVWKAIDHFDADKGALGQWFYLICRNRAFDELRKRRKRPAEISGDAVGWSLNDPRLHHQPVEASTNNSQLLADLNEIMSGLPPQDRDLLLSPEDAADQGHWAVEMAARRSVSPGSLRTRRSRLKAKVRTLLIQRGHLTDRKKP
jgi:RNA polymerase sigma factor (sigma-70 family)